MPISRRHLLATGGSCAVAGALSAACGLSGGSSDGSGGGPRLEQWYHPYGEDGTAEAVKRYAGAYREAAVEVQWRPGDDYDELLGAALLSPSGPDVFEIDGPRLDQIAGGQVVDLSELFEGVRDDFSPAVLEPKTYGGKIWAVPQFIDMQMLYYRKSLLSDAGLEPPETLDALIDSAKALTTGKTKGLFLGNDGGAAALGATPLYAAGLELVTGDGEVGFDDPAAARVLGKLRTLRSDKSLLLDAPLDWSDPEAFTEGRTAMQWSGLWALPQVSERLGDDFGVLPFPRDGSSGTPSVPIGAYGAAVNARSEHKDAAKAYVKWLWIDRKDFQEDFALSYGFHIPARTSLAERARGLREGAAADAVRFSADHGYASPLRWTTPSRTAYQEALGRVLGGGASAESELKAVVRTASDELRKVRRKS